MSKKLWSPTETDSRDLVSTSLNVRSENTAQHSTWFRTREQTSKEPNKNLQKICSQFVTTSWQNNGRRAAANVKIDKKVLKNPQHVQHVDAEKITKALGNRVLTRKIKLNVRTQKDRNWLNTAFGNARWNYNKAVEMMNNPTTRNEQRESGLSWRKFLRSKILNSDCDVIHDNAWLLELGYDICDDAVKDVLTATKGNMTKLSKGDTTKFRMRYRNRKKLTSESIYLRPRWIHSKPKTP